jgi:LmbE family N-acetylglucosaminyl deacetylase
MATLVVFHAHPDDEVVTTGGTIARAADEGHRVVLVVATDGDHGESHGVEQGRLLVDHRRAETLCSAQVLGIQRVAWLGYKDSGMHGWEQNHDPGSFLQAPVEEAAEKLAAILREEAADVLTVYDWHGNYGHPDHIKVHSVGYRAAELAGTPSIWEATMNRDAFYRWIELARSEGVELPDVDVEGPSDDGNPFGTAESEIALSVDVAAWVGRKREALACHASQVSDSGFFLSLPEERFAAWFGTEYFNRRDAGPGMRHGWLW